MAEKIDCSLDDAERALQFLHCEDTDEWLRAGMALKDEFGDGAMDVWIDWSAGDKRFKKKECESRWKKWKGSNARGTVGIGYIFKLALERGFKFNRPELTAEQKAAFVKVCEERRLAREAERILEERDVQRWYDAVARTSGELVKHLRTVGSSPYLGKKRVGGFGVLFPPHSFVIKTDENFVIDLHIGGKAVADFFIKHKQADKRNEDESFLFFKKDSILVPMVGPDGLLRNLQIIFTDGKKKRFLTNGPKTGLYHVIGQITADSPIIFCEGYATGASVHMATGYPVVICFDANNIPPVAQHFEGVSNLKLIAGDNDWKTALDPKKKNIGLVKAQEGAVVCGGSWCVAEFSEEQKVLEQFGEKGPSDFNDLHQVAGLEAVRLQVEGALAVALQTIKEPSCEPPAYEDVPIDAYAADIAQDSQNQSSEVRQPIKGEKTVFSIEVLLSRFNFIVQDGSTWDTKTQSKIKKTAFNDLVGKPLADEWRQHPDRVDVDLDELRNFMAHQRKAEREASFSEDEKWMLRFTYNERWEVKADIANTRLVLENDPRWRGVVAYCQFSYRVLKRKAPPFDFGAEGEWSDADTDRLRIWLSDNYRFTPKTADALGAVVVVAEANGFHPVREYLRGLEWDGQHRFNAWLHYYLGAEQTLYNSLVGRMFMIGAIARVMQPPVKMDNVLIFEGLQGLGKSTALRILADPWFTDTPLVLGDKDGFQQMQGVWIIELAELDSFNRAEHTRAKQFFGSQTDRYRPSYGRMTVTFPRQCVFAGTTNQSEYLRDATGNRRYWPVKCSRMEAELLERDRDQLWAEAFAAYNQGEKWWPSEIHKSLFDDQQEQRFDADVWEEIIDRWLCSITRDRVLISEVMGEALGMEPSQMKPPEQKRVGQIMAHLGWVRIRARVPGGRETAYTRPASLNLAA